MRRAARLAALLSLGACDRYVAVGHEDAPIAAAGAAASAPAGSGGSDVGSGGLIEVGQAGSDAGGTAQLAGAAGADDTPPGLPWFADHETGSLEQWLGDGRGRTTLDGNGQVDVTTERAHSGSHALVVTISANDKLQNQALVERDLRLGDGRYGAWFYLPQAVKTDYWVLMKLSNGSVDRFDIDIEVPSGGKPHLRLYEHDDGWITEPAVPVVPIGQWVHIEALYRSTPSSDGRVIVFQDGAQVLDTGARATASDDHVVFACGSSSRYVSPAPYRLFIDDASIEPAVVE